MTTSRSEYRDQPVQLATEAGSPAQERMIDRHADPQRHLREVDHAYDSGAALHRLRSTGSY